MRNPFQFSIALRAIEKLSTIVPPSSIALLASSSTAARELSNICASVFQINSGVNELQILSPTSLFRLAYEENIHISGSVTLGYPRLATNFESRSALHAALSSGALPLDTFRPANARFKNADALHRFFCDMQRAGVSPERLNSTQILSSRQTLPRGALASAMATADTIRRAELSSAYAAWMALKKKEGLLEMPEVILNILETLRDHSDKITVDSSISSSLQGALLASALQSKIRAIVCVDSDALDLGTLRLLHSVFGAGVSKLITPTLSSTTSPGSMTTRKSTSSLKTKTTIQSSKTKTIKKTASSVIDTSNETFVTQNEKKTEKTLSDRSVFLLLDDVYKGSSTHTAIQSLTNFANKSVFEYENRTTSLQSIQSEILNSPSSTLHEEDDDLPRSYHWSIMTTNSMESQSSPVVATAVLRGIKLNLDTIATTATTTTTKTAELLHRTDLASNQHLSSSTSSDLKKLKMESTIVSDSKSRVPISTSYFSKKLREEIKAQYVQTLLSPTSILSNSSVNETSLKEKNQPLITDFVECVGLNSNADEAYAISMTIKSLLLSNDSSTFSPPRSLAVLCKSNASASELGARLQNDLSQVANVYATTSTELWRVPELKWLISLLGTLVQPRDQTHWYLLLSSPLYGIPLPVVADWVRSAVSDPEQSGSMLRVLQSAAVPENRGKKGAALPHKMANLHASVSRTPLVNDEEWRVGLSSSSSSDSEDEFVTSQLGPSSPSPSHQQILNLKKSQSALNHSSNHIHPSIHVTLSNTTGTSSDSDDAAVLPRVTFDDDVIKISSFSSQSHQSNNHVNFQDRNAESAGGSFTDSTMHSLAVRRVIDDLAGFMSIYEKYGSVARALVWYVKKSPKLVSLLEPATLEQADSAAAVTALLVLAQRLELPKGGGGIKSAARKYSGLYHNGPDDAPLASLPVIFEAIKSTVNNGKLRFVSGGGPEAFFRNKKEGNTKTNRIFLSSSSSILVSDSEDGEGEEMIDVISKEASVVVDRIDGISDRVNSANSSDNESSSLLSENNASADDAALSPSFAQIEALLADPDTINAIDTAIQNAFQRKYTSKEEENEESSSTHPSFYIPIKRYLPPINSDTDTSIAIKPSVFVTTINKGKDQCYDVVLFPGCSHSAFPGRFIGNSSLPVPPQELFALTVDATREKQQNQSQIYLPPTAYDKDSHERISRLNFFKAVSCARNGVIFYCPGRPTQDAVSSRQARTKWLDLIFGPPPRLSTSPSTPSTTPLTSSLDTHGSTGLTVSIGTSEIPVFVSSPPSPLNNVSSDVNPSSLSSSSSSTSLSGVISPDKPLSLSFSSISDYEWCPQKYKLRKIDKLLPLPASNLEYGKALHASVAACAEIIAKPLFLEIERSKAFPIWIGSTSIDSDGAVNNPRASLEIASLALQILRGGRGSQTHISQQILDRIRTSAFRSLPTIEQVIRTMTAAYQSSWVPEGIATNSTRGGEGHSHSRVAWAAASPSQTSLLDSVRDGSAAGDTHAYVRAAVDGLLLDADEIRGYEISAKTAIRNFAERELFEMKRLLMPPSNNMINQNKSLENDIPLSLPALLEQYFSFSLDATGNMIHTSNTMISSTIANPIINPNPQNMGGSSSSTSSSSSSYLLLHLLPLPPLLPL
jgi:hypothetical protein